MGSSRDRAAVLIATAQGHKCIAAQSQLYVRKQLSQIRCYKWMSMSKNTVIMARPSVGLCSKSMGRLIAVTRRLSELSVSEDDWYEDVADPASVIATLKQVPRLEPTCLRSGNAYLKLNRNTNITSSGSRSLFFRSKALITGGTSRSKIRQEIWFAKLRRQALRYGKPLTMMHLFGDDRYLQRDTRASRIRHFGIMERTSTRLNENSRDFFLERI